MQNVNDIVTAVAFLAAQAKEAGATTLGNDLDQVVSAHSDGTPVENAPVTLHAVAPATAVETAPAVTTPGQLLADVAAALNAGTISLNSLEEVIDSYEDETDEADGDDNVPFAYGHGEIAMEHGQDADLDDAMYENAMPGDMTVTVTSVDNVTLTEGDVLAVADQVVDQLRMTVVGLGLDADDFRMVAREAARVDGVWNVTVTADNASTRQVLTAMGAGKEGINMTLPHHDGSMLTVVAVVGDPTDPEAAAELGMMPVQLPEVPEGQHEINGVLQVAEEFLGERPRATELVITYTRLDGAALSDADVAGIVAHPMSQAGLPRLGVGGRTPDRIDAGAEPNVKSAVFDLTGVNAEIDPAALDTQLAQITGAVAMYRGEVNLGPAYGIVRAVGSVHMRDMEIDLG